MAAFVRLLCGLFISILSLSACGGGGGSASSPLPAGSTKSAPGTAALSVFVPTGASSSARRRNLPSSTQSVEIAEESANGTVPNPPILPTIANVSATSPGCSSVSGGVSCTIDISIPYGSYIFAAVAFTGQNATGTPIAWGEAAATIGPTGSNAVAIATSSVIAYFTMSLDGDISLVAVDHNANTIAVANITSGTSIGGSITNLPNGDEKIVVTSSTDTNTAVGSVVYARELPGDALVFFSTGTSTPPAVGYVSSGADWGVGTALTACPTASISPEVSVASVEGPQFQVNPNFNQAPAFENGTAAITVGGSTTLAFSGSAYTLGGSFIGSQNGTTGACSGGIFAASSGSNGSGEIGYNAQGVVIGTNMNPNGSTSITNGFMGFTVQSGSTINLGSLTSGTYDGFLGYYNAVPTVVKGGSAITATPGGSNTLNWCNYSNFEAGNVDTSSCQTVTFTTQPEPGIVLGGIGSGSNMLPAVFDVSQIAGKYVIFGVESISGVNFVLIEH